MEISRISINLVNFGEFPTFFIKNGKSWFPGSYMSVLNWKIWFSVIFMFSIFIFASFSIFFLFFVKIMKKSSFSLRAVNSVKRKRLALFLRPESWKSMIFMNFTKFHKKWRISLKTWISLKNWFFMKFLKFRLFSPSGRPKNLVLQQCFQPWAQNWWNFIKFSKKSIF